MKKNEIKLKGPVEHYQMEHVSIVGVPGIDRVCDKWREKEKKGERERNGEKIWKCTKKARKKIHAITVI